MSKEKPIIKSIPRIYKRQAIDNLMFGYVLGMQRALPTVTIKRAIEEFVKDFDLTEEEYSIDSALMSFYSIYQCHRGEKLGNNVDKPCI